MEDKRRLLEEKTALLNKAAKAYYQENTEIMSNLEYDKLYDELEELEKELGIVLSSSPTIRVGYEVLSGLPKENHPMPMLSLDKTKSVEELISWLGSYEGILSWKLDGLTIVLTYENGKLAKAVTRGDGKTGEVITNNARVFDNIPLIIPEKNKVVIRGEAVISYEEFERINREIGNVDAAYKNPRNLCSGTVRQLNNEVTAKRNVEFFAFSLAEGGPEASLREEELRWIKSQGFETVEYLKVRGETLEEAVASFAQKTEKFRLPTDGLVLIYNDIEYGKSLGFTSKFPRDSMAFKWRDELKETTLKEIIWNVSRTGLINPIAVFEPVELEGTTVSRASVHNLSIVKSLKLGIGDIIKVFKANMIIPQISENLTGSGTVTPPERCPVCGSATEIHNDNGIETLHCPNDECPAKKIKAFTHFVSRNALNIEGLSEATLEKFIDEGIVRSFADLFELDKFKEKIIDMEGFGVKSYENLIKSIEKASDTTPARLLYSLGIPNIGVANASMISASCKNKWSKIRSLNQEELIEIDGIGEVMARGYVEFFKDEKNEKIVEQLLKHLKLDESYEENSSDVLAGKTFVITGKVYSFTNRDEAKATIEAAGGKTAGSVSNKTDYLVNNDITSASSKNKKAKELGIPIITEQQLIEMLEE